MGRAKKHVSRFWYTEEVERQSQKYKNKWIQGKDGKWFICSVYYGIGGINCSVFRDSNFKGVGTQKLLTDIETNYTISPI